MDALPVLRLLRLHLPVLGIGESIRHVSLGNDTRQLSEEAIGDGAITTVGIGGCRRGKAGAMLSPPS